MLGMPLLREKFLFKFYGEKRANSVYLFGIVDLGVPKYYWSSILCNPESGQARQLLVPLLPALVDGLVNMATNFSSSSEILGLILENLAVVLTCDPQFTASQAEIKAGIFRLKRLTLNNFWLVLRLYKVFFNPAPLDLLHWCTTLLPCLQLGLLCEGLRI